MAVTEYIFGTFEKLLEALARLQPKGTPMFLRYLLALEVLWGSGNISLRLSNSFRYWHIEFQCFLIPIADDDVAY